MFLTILALLSALSVSTVAIWYSVVGLMSIFSGAAVAIAVMGVTLEVGKLVATVWLHQNWNHTKLTLKIYLTTSVVVLMFITSMGIFGFLSRAHIEQTALTTDQFAQIEAINEQIVRSVSKIETWTGEIDRLNKGQDVRVDQLIVREQDALKEIYDKVNKDKKTYKDQSDEDIQNQNDRLAQAQQRKKDDQARADQQMDDALIDEEKYNQEIERSRRAELGVAARVQREIIAIKKELRVQHKRIDNMYAPQVQDINNRIAKLREQASLKTEDIDTRVNELDAFISAEIKRQDGVREQKRVLESGYRKLEAEVGPVKYIAALVYGESVDQQLLEEAVRLVTIIIIFVFDPFAVFMLLAASEGFIMWRRKKDENAEKQPTQQKQVPPTSSTTPMADREGFGATRTSEPTQEIRTVPPVLVDPEPEPEPWPEPEREQPTIAEELANDYLDKPEDIAQDYLDRPEDIAQEYFEPEPEDEAGWSMLDEPPIKTEVTEELEIKVVDREPQEAIIQEDFDDAHYAVTDEQRQKILASFDDSFNSATTDEITSDEVHQKEKDDVDVEVDDQKKDLIIDKEEDNVASFWKELQGVSVTQKESDTDTEVIEELKEEINQKFDEVLGTDVSEDVKTAVYQRQEVATEAETEINEDLESKADFAEPIEGRFSTEEDATIETLEDFKVAMTQRQDVVTETDTTIAEDLQTSDDNTDNVQETYADTHTLDERKEDEGIENFDEVVGVKSTDTVQIEEVLANADQDTLDQVYAELEKDKTVKSKVMGEPWSKTADEYDSSVKAKVTEEELRKRKENAKGDGWLDE